MIELQLVETAKDRVDKPEVTDAPSPMHSPNGVFNQSAEKIASFLLDKGKHQAMGRIAFYLNRAPDKLAPDLKERLEGAKEIIRGETSETA